jgi:hypothetical protein
MMCHWKKKTLTAEKIPDLPNSGGDGGERYTTRGLRRSSLRVIISVISRWRGQSSTTKSMKNYTKVDQMRVGCEAGGFSWMAGDVFTDL